MSVWHTSKIHHNRSENSVEFLGNAFIDEQIYHSNDEVRSFNSAIR